MQSLIAPRCFCRRVRRSLERDGLDTNIAEPVASITDSTGYHDSILDEDEEQEDVDDETQPLITNNSDAKYKQLE